MLLATGTAFASPGFHVAGRNLKDANGHNFYPRGINNPHIWFDAYAYNALPGIAARKTNCIRVVWGRQGSAARLDQIFQRCEELKMVPIVELHDGTGNNDPQALVDNARYYTRGDVLAVLKKHQRDVLINIGNEWSNGEKSPADWMQAYKAPISIFRAAGIVTTIAVDNPGYAQNYLTGIQNGQALLDFDPKHNLLFSVHMYSGFDQTTNIYDAISGYHKANLLLLIGEFGYNSNNNLHCTVDHRLVMKYASQFDYGYIAWSTQGNDAPNHWLDLMTQWSKLTWWGNEVFNGPDGITKNSRPASIFEQGAR